MASYLTVARYKALTVIPEAWVDEIEALSPGWTLVQLEYLSSWVDTRLRKRYAVPFGSPPPVIVEGWIARLMTLRCLLRRGVDPTDQQFQQIQTDHNTAQSEITEAADSKDGLFDLPLRADTSTSGVTQGSPRGYSEQSPYVGYDRQREAGRTEDQNRSGTG